MQIIFQDPFASLNPRMTVGEIVGEPLTHPSACPRPRAREDRVAELLEPVGLRRAHDDAIRTNSPAGSASASASPARWR